MNMHPMYVCSVHAELQMPVRSCCITNGTPGEVRQVVLHRVLLLMTGKPNGRQDLPGGSPGHLPARCPHSGKRVCRSAEDAGQVTASPEERRQRAV